MREGQCEGERGREGELGGEREAGALRPLLHVFHTSCACASAPAAGSVPFQTFSHMQVRLLSGQLREAQNLIAAKDRQGAWRGPDELANLQVRGRGEKRRT